MISSHTEKESPLENLNAGARSRQKSQKKWEAKKKEQQRHQVQPEQDSGTRKFMITPKDARTK